VNAFDCVNYEMLLTKLYFPGIQEQWQVGSGTMEQTENERSK
jgi:hypothetical protein